MQLGNKIISIICVFIFASMNLPLETIQATSAETSQDNLFMPVENMYPFDGLNHHPSNPSFNAVHTDLIRTSFHGGEYSDNWAARANASSPREISNILCASNETVLDEHNLSDYNWIWGQFVTHDIDFTLTQNGRVQYPETIDIPIPQGDVWLDPYSVGSLEIPMHRSIFNTSTSNETVPREFPNSITGWMDGSMVYGSSLKDSNWLRTFSRGQLKVTETEQGEFLPLAGDDDDDAPAVSFVGFSASERYVAGDPRANEHAGLIAMHVIFVREHNRLAELIITQNDSLNDEQIYQLARKINNAQMQRITYSEYLPSLGIELADYEGFDETIDPRISNEFATLAFRMGHSQITEQTLRLNDIFLEHWSGHRNLSDGFWNPTEMINTGGIGPTLRGAAWATQAANDIYTVHDLRNSMFGEPGFGGMDMCAIDIQRGRDHGLPDYNSVRESLGFDRISNWSEISTDLEVIERMNRAYPDINNADPIMGMYAEQHLDGSSLGESMHALISDQYLRLRDADPLFYENDPEMTPYLDMVNQSTLAEIILRNSEINLIQCEVMFAVKDTNDMECFSNDYSKYSGPIEKFDYEGKGIELETLPINLVDKTADSGLDIIGITDKLHWSAYGPSIATADCNNDGFEDIWIGNSYDQELSESPDNSPVDFYLMINDGDGTFSDFTESSGLDTSTKTFLGASWADYDNDGDLDLYLSNAGMYTVFEIIYPNVLYQNDGNCQFTDVTASVGLGNLGHSSTSSWADYDHDGDLDLMSHNSGTISSDNATLRAETDILYKNQLSETGSATFVDYTLEAGGVYGTIYIPNNDEIGIGELMTYTSAAAKNPSSQMSVSFPALSEQKAFDKNGTGVSWAGLFIDLGNDGWEDIFIATDFGISPIYKNMGDGTFVSHTEESNLMIHGTAMGFDAGDVDGDGDVDICQSNFGPNYLFKQTSDMRFEESSDSSGLNFGTSARSVTWDCNFVDIDLDGDLDLWFGSGSITPYTTFSYNSIYLNDGDGNFGETIFTSDILHPIAKTMGSTWADFDLDGDLDLILAESNFGMKYFENDAAQVQDSRWLAIDVLADIDQSGVNVTAVNAKVDIKFSNDKVVRQIVKIGSGYSGSKDSTIHLGVPPGETVESITITWNDGSSKVIENPTLNEYIVVQNTMNYTESVYSEVTNEESPSQSSSIISVTVLGLVIFLIILAAFNSRKSN